MKQENQSVEEIGPHFPQNKQTAPSKLQRGKKHCPVCLAPLAKNAPRTRLVRNCVACQAHVSAGKHCLKCLAAAIWENKSLAACQACGLHGKKSEVIDADQ